MWENVSGLPDEFLKWATWYKIVIFILSMYAMAECYTPTIHLAEQSGYFDLVSKLFSNAL
jgi:hypothetical protein